MMTKSTPDATNGTSAHSTQFPVTELAAPSTGTDKPAHPGTSTPESGSAVRGRIQQFTGALHQAIDKIEQGLSSKGGVVSSTQAKYGEQARQYGETLRTQINARPLQAAGVALGVGVLLAKLFSRAPKAPAVHVVQVRVPVPAPAWQPTVSPARSASRWTDAVAAPARSSSRWTDAARAQSRDLVKTGRQAMDEVGATAEAGLSGTRELASAVARSASALPQQMRIVTDRLLAKSQEYGSVARSGVQTHPLIGMGAVAGAGALLTAWLMQRRG